MDTLTFLYTATGFFTGAAFVPQIIALLKDRSGAEAVSLSSVFMFTLCSVVVCAYALVNNGDVYFVFGTAVCTVGNIAVFTLAAWRKWRKACQEEGELAPLKVRVRR